MARFGRSFPSRQTVLTRRLLGVWTTSTVVQTRATGSLDVDTAKASSTTVTIRGGTRLLDAAAKAGTNTIAIKATGRVIDAAVRTGTNTVTIKGTNRAISAATKSASGSHIERGTSRLEADTIHGGLSAAIQRAQGLLTAIGTHVTSGAGTGRLLGWVASIASIREEAESVATRGLARFSVQTIKTGLSDITLRAGGHQANASAKASTASSSESAEASLSVVVSTERLNSTRFDAVAFILQPLSFDTFRESTGYARARIVATSIRGSLEAVAVRAQGTTLIDSIKASITTASEHAEGMLQSIIAPIRTGTAWIRSTAFLRGSSMFTPLGAAILGGMARLSASGVKDSISTGSLASNSSLIASGAKSASAQARVTEWGQMSVATSRTSLAVALIRGKAIIVPASIGTRSSTVAMLGVARLRSVDLSAGALRNWEWEVGEPDKKWASADPESSWTTGEPTNLWVGGAAEG